MPGDTDAPVSNSDDSHWHWWLVMRLIPFILGVGLILVGVSSYFHGVPLPIELGRRTFSVGAFDFTLELAMIVAGALIVLISMSTPRPKR